MNRVAPWAVVWALLIAAWVVVGPWGDFPLNDDWTFAHFAKHLAEKGFIKLDAPSSPNVVGQAIIGAGLTKVFGFSYLVLRLFTMALTLAGLWAVDSMLKACVDSKAVRVMALSTLAFNPIVFYMSTTFMTELYGWLPVVLTASVWFWDRRRRTESDQSLVSFWVAVAVGLLCGASFWTRQLCVLMYPALLGATLLRALANRQFRAVLRTLPALAVGTAVFGAVIAAYVPWAKSTGNFRPEFAERLGHLTQVNAQAYRLQVGAVVIYMTAYFAPWLALASWRKARLWALGLGVAALMGLVWTTRAQFQAYAQHDFFIGPIWAHKVFPYLVNIVWNAGVGPFTFDDTFFYDVPKPSWSKDTWARIEVALLLGAAAWSPVGAAFFRLVRAQRAQTRLEVPLAGALLALGSTFAIIQVHQLEMVDRYHLPVILGLALAVPPAIALGRAESWRPWRLGLFAVVFLPVALFSILGVHDQFRWNEARWELFDTARAQGGTYVTVQGGYEMNCWWQYDGRLTSEARTCGDACRCVYQNFCCTDDEWRLGLSVLPGYSEVASKQPRYWLAPGPPVVLSRRPR